METFKLNYSIFWTWKNVFISSRYKCKWTKTLACYWNELIKKNYTKILELLTLMWMNIIVTALCFFIIKRGIFIFFLIIKLNYKYFESNLVSCAFERLFDIYVHF